MVTAANIRHTVARFYGISEAELVHGGRGAKYARPRHIAWLLTRRLTPLSYPNIAKRYGGKDHTTVLEGCKKAEHRLLSDPKTAQDVSDLVGRLTDALKGAEE